MSKIEITEKEHQIYEQNQDLIKKLISGEHNCFVTKVNLDNEESEVLKLNVEKDAVKFQEDYDRLLFKYTETVASLTESKLSGKSLLDGELREKINEIRELKSEVKRLSRRNWFHKLFNL